MSESRSTSNGSYIQNTIQNLKNKVFPTKIQASLNSVPVMAAHPNLNMVRLDAREMATDTVHFLSDYQVLAPPSEHCKTMRRTAIEMRQKHQILFDSMVRKLNLPDQDRDGIAQEIRNSFFTVADEVFRDKQINWGRIVSLYAFGGVYAKHFADKNLHSYIDLCGQLIGDYVCEKLAAWILSKGGWDEFDKYFDNGGILEGHIWRGLLMVGGIGVVALGVVAVR